MDGNIILKCENKDFCNIIMPSENTKTLEFNKYLNFNKASPKLECLIEKIDGCKNNTENSFTKKVGEHIPSDFSMSTISSFKRIGKMHDVYRGKNSIKMFCESLREHVMKRISFRKKKIKSLTKEQ